MNELKLTDHLKRNIVLTLEVTNQNIQQFPERKEYLPLIKECLEGANEVYFFEYSQDILAFKYLKFYREGAMIVITNMNDVWQQPVIEWYFLEGKEILVDGEIINEIDNERQGILKHTNIT